VDKIDFMKVRDTFLGHMFIKIITLDDNKAEELSEKHNHGEDYEISMFISGVEVSFVDAVKDLETQLDWYVSKKADELISDKMVGIHDLTYELLEDVEHKIREELNIPKEEY